MEQTEINDKVVAVCQDVENLKGWQRTQNGALVRLDEKFGRLDEKLDKVVDEIKKEFALKVDDVKKEYTGLTKKSESRLYNLLEKGGFVLFGIIVSRIF